MDEDDFESVASPILANALAEARKILIAYSDRERDPLPPSDDEVKVYLEKAKSAIKELNSLKRVLEPGKGGLLSVTMPSPLEGITKEWKNFVDVESVKDDLILNLCRAYGIEPPDLSHIYMDHSAFKDLIVRLASETLRTPLQTRQQGRVQKPEGEKLYHHTRDEIMADTFTQLKSELKTKLSDMKICDQIIQRAGNSSEFEIDCLRFTNFFLKSMAKGRVTEASFVNRITEARRRLRNHK